MRDPGEHLDALIDAERSITSPAGTREAAWSTLQARLELAAVPSATVATGGLVKLAAVVGLAAIVVAGAVLVVDSPVPPASSVLTPGTGPEPPVPEVSPAAPSPAPPADTSIAELPVPKDSPEIDPPAPDNADPGDTWTAELAALREIHAALRDGQPDLARARADAYAHQWPRGEFREEVDAARILGLCAEDRGPAARRAVAAFARRWPTSLYTTRLRLRCGPASRDGRPGAADTSG